MDVIELIRVKPLFLTIFFDEFAVLQVSIWLDLAQVCPNYIGLRVFVRKVECPDTRS